MPKERARADPVSCQSCRSKKLKCDRAQPCSNCITRRISCNYKVPPPGPADSRTTIHSNAELLKRIERLEHIIQNQGNSVQPEPDAPSGSRLAASEHSSGTSFTTRFAVSDHQNIDQDSRALENFGTRDDSLLFCLSNDLVYRIISTHNILLEERQMKSASLSEHRNETIITLPTPKIAFMLFHTYESNVDHHVKILHKPTVRSMISSFYSRMNQNEPVPPGQAALLLSLFAISAYFYDPLDNPEVAPTKQDALQLSKAFSKSALDVLDYSRRNTSSTLEDLQGYILMSFVTCHLDGYSARYRILCTTALAIARELRLHRLDAPDESITTQNENSFRIPIDYEVKRRVFWHITATDWLGSFTSGPQEGMYFVHPNHINVKLPKDRTDDDLILGDDDLSATEPHPAGMRFFLERVRLAHLCREMTDIVPLETSKLLQIPYEQITALDTKLLEFLANLPFFYKIDAESFQRSKPLESIYPKIPVLRYCINAEAHSRRCKLHHRLLIQQSFDSRYAFSRQACLESACVVVRLFDDLRGSDSLTTSPELMGIAVHFTHLALVVMAMDLCFNKGENDGPEVMGEVKAALQMFEDSRHPSPLQSQFLSSLRGVLRKHKVKLSNPPILRDHDGAASASPTQNMMMLDSTSNALNFDQMQYSQVPPMDMPNSGMDFDFSFEDFWQTAMQSEPDTDFAFWDNLFSTVDSHPL